MPALRNPKHEIVARELAAGKTSAEASAMAGFGVAGKTASANARKRSHRKDIKARAAEIREIAAAGPVAGVVVTLEKLIHDAQRAIKKAEGDEKGAAGAAAMVSAITCQAKLSGFWVDKSAATDPTGTHAVAPIVIEIVRFSNASTAASSQAAA